MLGLGLNIVRNRNILGEAPNNSLAFTGDGDAVEIDSWSPGSGGVYSFGFRVQSLQTGVSKYLFDTDGGARLVLAWLNPSGVLGLFDGTSWVSFGATPNDGDEHSIVFEINGTVASCYVDGEQSGDFQTINALSLNAQTNSSIANRFDVTGSDGFNGNISDVRVWTKALSYEERLVFWTGAEVKDEIVNTWDFSGLAEGATTLPDTTGSDNGTIVGAEAANYTQTINTVDYWLPTDLTTQPTGWFDGNDESQITTDANNFVEAWGNKGSGSEATQTTQDFKPIYLSSDKAVSFALDSLEMATNIGVKAALFVVSDADGGSGNNQVMSLLGDSNAAPDDHGIFLRTNAVDYTLSLDGSSLNTGDAAIDGEMPTPGDLSGTNISLTGFVGFPTESTKRIIFVRIDTEEQFNRICAIRDNQFRGKCKLYDIVLLDYYPTLTDRERIEGYLAHKHNVWSNLPSGHPYRGVPPVNLDLWTPSNLPTVPSAWFDADDTRSITLNGSDISAWRSKSNVHTLAQPTAALQPAYVQGTSTLKFKSFADFAGAEYISNSTLATEFSGSNPQLFMVFLLRTDTNGVTVPIGFTSTSTDTPVRLVRIDSASSNINFFERGDTGGQSEVTGGSVGSLAIVTVVSSWGSINIRRNGVADGSASVALNPVTLNTFTLGALVRTTISSYFNGLICENIIGQTITDSDIERAEGYIAHHWMGAGANNPLDSGHPWKNTPPIKSLNVIDGTDNVIDGSDNVIDE